MANSKKLKKFLIGYNAKIKKLKIKNIKEAKKKPIGVIEIEKINYKYQYHD